MTKLDQKWAQGIRDNVNALILEVERLESVGDTLESNLAKYKSACDVMMAGLIFLKDRTGDSACTWRCDISAGKTIAEAKRIMGEK